MLLVQSPKVWYKKTRRPGNKGTSGDNSKYGIVGIGQNTEIRGDLRRLAVTQTPIKRLSANTDMRNSQGVK